VLLEEQLAHKDEIFTIGTLFHINLILGIRLFVS